MEGQSTNGQPQYHYPSAQWSRLLSRRNTLAAPTPLSPVGAIQSPQFPTHLDLLPTLLPQQSSAYQEQLANYNKLIASGRTNRVQSSPLPPKLSTAHVLAASRTASSSYDTGKRSRNNSRGGHGNKNATGTGNGERSLVTTGDTGVKMAGRKQDAQNNLIPRPLPQHRNSSISQQSNSVPSTPHQHPRKFSLSSREPSPNAATNHSPRSAYSESNSTLPSLRPLPPRLSGCKYETAMVHGRRRMPYNLGSEKLDGVKPEDLKPSLTRDGERKLTGDMRELYDRLLPSSEGEARREKFVRKLEKLLNDEWPGHDIRVHMFGSSGNLLCTDESDGGMEKVICVSTAKVPIVKIWDPELGLACDMNVNNPTALENTRMIKTYVQIDERVRPLAMIIKHWTKRRVVNDAAFGGTLSSYTWICMIINFLQTRNPPVLPALHQLPHLKLAPKQGHETEFADNVEALKGFGETNKETLGELLFHFFRFYGHEIDYDKSVVSVRNGKLISKVDKGWHQATNNSLCVEEPFNTPRNLGNTADEFSFRGLHMELRRAFDLIVEARLDACCEEYVFPKEEERIWERPPPQPRPILSRTSSQTNHSNRRGGFRGNRHNNRNGGNNGRRASSGAFDSSSGYNAQQLPQGFMSPEQFLQAQQAQQNLHTELYTQLSQLKAQENNLRFQLYNQSHQYAQMQAQAYAHQAQRPQGNGGSMAQQANERNRGNSFDNAPLTAPIRPDMYFYPMLHPASMYGQHSPSTYPSSPSMTPAVPESRRSLHRSTGTNAAGQGGSAANSSMRSHSQPATRSVPQPLNLHGLPTSHYGTSHFAGYSHPQPNGILIPNFIADEHGETNPDIIRPLSAAGHSTESRTPKEYLGYYVNGAVSDLPRKQMITLQAIPAFGDISQSRRRLSSDQFPHTVFDRVRHTSRSPSPLGRHRSHATEPALTPQSATSSSNLRPPHEQRPVIVNGSSSVPTSRSPAEQAAVSESPSSEERNHLTTDLHQPMKIQSSRSWDERSSQSSVSGHQHTNGLITEFHHDQSIVASGSRSALPDSPQQLLGLGIVSEPHSAVPAAQNLAAAVQSNGAVRATSSDRLRSSRQHIAGGTSPIDVGVSQNEILRDDVPHLSPVYETRSPSPNAHRKFDLKQDIPLADAFLTQASKNHESNVALKLALTNSSHKPATTTSSKPANGHTRAAKSEGSASGWAKVQKGKKKGQDQKSGPGGNKFLTEKSPRNDSERKGG
ncbi:MAG: hypothetical protein M1818_003247 [Claussenomyces sp. TS43310]|nr:MAG: hypothetical protein M1818_003247 [Claussenomyces sp. TS43310]